MRIPIACSLTADDARTQLEAWRSFFATGVAAVRAPDPGRLRVRLADGDTALLTATGLARRERACCPFFGFALDLDDEGWWLQLSVPAGGEPVLADLAGLLPPGLRPGP